MQTQTTRTTNRAASPARWQAAAQRAVAEQVQVLQLSGSGQWIATSGSDASTAYELDITGAIAHGCTCLAGLNGDPVCKHRAAYYLGIGALTIEPEVSRSGRYVACTVCGGQGSVAGPGRSRPTCSACRGRGRFVRQAAA